MTAELRTRRRVVVTGMGAVTALGNSVDAFWSGLVAGRSGIGPMTLAPVEGYPTKVSAEIHDFDPTRYVERREARRMARFSQYGVAAARMAIDDAGLDLDAEDRSRIGTYVGNGNGGFPEIEQAVRVIVQRHGMKIDPLFFPKSLPNMAAAQISLQFGLKGYSNTVITACAAGTQAIGEAVEVVRRGTVDVIVAGGAEGGISELGQAGFCVIRAMTSWEGDPAHASRPFDATRDGFVPADGAAMLILESLEHARARGARILAEIAGYGASADAYHLVAPDETGEGAVLAMQRAIADAGLGIDDVDYVNAHGTSTPLNDAVETTAIKRVFGERAYQVPVSSTKSMIGHAFGAAGALEAVASVKTIETDTIHPTINYEHPDPQCDLDYVPNVARNQRVGAVLSNSFGFGGQNACLLFKRFEG